MNRTRVASWRPPFTQALRLAWRPIVSYLVFSVLGFFAIAGSVLWYSHGSKDLLALAIIFFAGLFGIVLGMFLGVLRVRTLPVVLAVTAISFVVGWTLALTGIGGALPPELFLAFFVFAMAFPCGMLALQHRWELFSSFWPSVGWIGGVFVIINEEGRIRQWEQDKVTAWLPVPLFFTGCFLVLWLFYLASKQAVRVEIWQALSGSVGRRVAKKPTVGAIPRRNILPMLVVSALLFVVVALLAPYLWRTGKGDRESKRQQEQTEPREERQTPKMDGEAIAEQLKKMAQAAKDTAVNLWPLLLLFLLYRPAKRGLLKTHLLTPVFPTPPTERIDNNWEYVRIAAEDAGVVPQASDSIEQLVKRIRAAGLGGVHLEKAAEIYARTRYGFVVAPGDAIAMRSHAAQAAKELSVNLTTWDRVRNWWRPLS
ncbi:MAG: hypothetical protein JST00_12155 [Deltaproteobacteria bacterium]|nr:hypothetical protein [Deltaproteobacteria bacterium]